MVFKFKVSEGIGNRGERESESNYYHNCYYQQVCVHHHHRRQSGNQSVSYCLDVIYNVFMGLLFCRYYNSLIRRWNYYCVD